MNKNMLVALMAIGVSFGGASGALAANNDSRSDQVVDRLQDQNSRIKEERREGDLTPSQAKKLRSEDRSIYQQEQLDAAKHGGNITKREQKTLNKEENGVSKQIPK